MTRLWLRRDWLVTQCRAAVNAAALVALTPRAPRSPRGAAPWRRLGIGRLASPAAGTAARLAPHAARLEPGPLQALAQPAVEAARTAGASYADARLTRTVQYAFSLCDPVMLGKDEELVGVGVRALVDGYWGFAASPSWTPDDVVRLARDAVAQAQEGANGPPRPVELGAIPVVTGTWETPVRIDPFTIPLEEIQDYLNNIKAAAGPTFPGGLNCLFSWLGLAREERVLATSDGSLVTQTMFESGAEIILGGGLLGTGPTVRVHGLDVAGKGWELFLDAKVIDQFPRLTEELAQKTAGGQKPVTIGRYTLVVDGITMGSLVAQTLGVATQLDRALGYEADAHGTSFIDDPLAMVGHLQIASPLVTVTGNRSAPAELATVCWDDEGVVPVDTALITAGVLTDFQTTREQAAWLAPYYHAHGRPVRSNGDAAAQDALSLTLQHMPNLALTPSPADIRLADLVADVQDGILLTEGTVYQDDAQARTGVIEGDMQQIHNGRLGHHVTGGAVLLHTQAWWKSVVALGGVPTEQGISYSKFMGGWQIGTWPESKGQPPQRTSYSVRAAAATITNQPVIDVARKA